MLLNFKERKDMKTLILNSLIKKFEKNRKKFLLLLVGGTTAIFFKPVIRKKHTSQ